MDETAKANRQTKRRRQILSATLRLLRRHGSGISTAQIAAESNCSKETMYSWFGDREGIFLALAQEQAEAMSAALHSSLRKSENETFQNKIHKSCVSLLDIMTGEALIAVNRAAMAESCREKADLGLTILDDWQARITQPMLDLIEEGRAEGIVEFSDPAEALDILMGLLIGDRQRRLLLGEYARPDFAAMESHSEKAANMWIRLHSI